MTLCSGVEVAVWVQVVVITFDRSCCIHLKRLWVENVVLPSPQPLSYIGDGKGDSSKSIFELDIGKVISFVVCHYLEHHSSTASKCMYLYGLGDNWVNISIKCTMKFFNIPLRVERECDEYLLIPLLCREL